MQSLWRQISAPNRNIAINSSRSIWIFFHFFTFYDFSLAAAHLSLQISLTLNKIYMQMWSPHHPLCIRRERDRCQSVANWRWCCAANFFFHTCEERIWWCDDWLGLINLMAICIHKRCWSTMAAHICFARSTQLSIFARNKFNFLIWKLTKKKEVQRNSCREIENGKRRLEIFKT